LAIGFVIETDDAVVVVDANSKLPGRLSLYISVIFEECQLGSLLIEYGSIVDLEFFVIEVKFTLKNRLFKLKQYKKDILIILLHFRLNLVF